MLRAYELGIHLEELRCFNTGEFMDMLVEKGNDTEEWPDLPTQADFDAFGR